MNKKTITMTGLTPMLKANNLDQTIAFYTGILGFTLQNRMDHWCALASGKAEVMFYDHNDHESGPAKMSGVLYFNPTDVKALWEDLKDRTEVEWKLQTMFYNMVEFAIRDCNGYTLSFAQDISDVSPPLPPRCEE